MACDKCKDIRDSYDGKPFVPPGGSRNDETYKCSCGATYWQFNNYYHLWREVPLETYQAVRSGADVVIDVGSGEVIGRGRDFI